VAKIGGAEGRVEPERYEDPRVLARIGPACPFRGFSISPPPLCNRQIPSPDSLREQLSPRGWDRLRPPQRLEDILADVRSVALVDHGDRRAAVLGESYFVFCAEPVGSQSEHPLLYDSIDGLSFGSVLRVTGRQIVSAIIESGMSATRKMDPGTAARFIGARGCVAMQFHTTPTVETANLVPE